MINKIVSDAYLGKNKVVLFFRDKDIEFSVPTVRQYLDMLSIAGTDDLLGVTVEMIPKVLSVMAEIPKKIDEDILSEYEKFLRVIYATDYFENIPKRQKKQKETKFLGGKTVSSQITSFMEDLGMSLNEVLNTSYPLLLIMQHDKIRADYDSKDEPVIEEISGKEMLKRKRG